MAGAMQAIPADLVPIEVFARLLLAAALSAAIGLEREMHGKQAGLRTMILIGLGAALLTELSLVLTKTGGDGTRIAANIVTGIGFIGAGAIMRHDGHVQGLTTAATIWVVAAVGMAVGGHQYMAAIGTTVLVLMVLVPLRWWERRVDRRKHEPRVTIGSG